jgi:hypothetical protein
LAISLSISAKTQSWNCNFKKPVITVHFGSGDVRDINSDESFNYERVQNSCPTDGHYTYTSYTSECFRGDWFTMEDHTPGDASGNMLLVNSSYTTGTFFKTTVSGLKGGTTYEFGVWLMNVCRITEKCPFPLLPNLTIILQTAEGKTVAQIGTGEVQRVRSPQWTQHTIIFTTPPAKTSLTIVMENSQPGGCGNDFALDDITFRECIKIPPPVVTTPKTTTPKTTTPKTTTPKTTVTKKPQPATVNPPAKKPTPVAPTNAPKTVTIVKQQKDSQVLSPPIAKLKPRAFPPPPPILKTRENTLVKQIETEAGQIKVSLYDNGDIDGDTISIYHNNVRIISHARLSAKPISINIAVDSSQPHHELVMVAENLGSIPPNTSVMVINAGDKRYEVFISSNEQRNAKVILNLKQ